jgi:hypothetical protein
MKYHEAVKMPKWNEWMGSCLMRRTQLEAYGTQNFPLLEYTLLGAECKLTAIFDSR